MSGITSSIAPHNGLESFGSEEEDRFRFNVSSQEVTESCRLILEESSEGTARCKWLEGGLRHVILGAQVKVSANGRIKGEDPNEYLDEGTYVIRITAYCNI